MSVKYSKKAVYTMEVAYEIATKNGTVCGIPHVMMAIMRYDDFISVYPETTEHSYMDLYKIVSHAIKVYAPMSSYGKIGDDWKIIEDNLFADLYSYTKSIVPTSAISLAHLFFASCTQMGVLRLEEYFESMEIDVTKLFLDIATFDEVEKSKVNYERSEELNFFYKYNGTHLERVLRKKINPMEGIPTPKYKDLMSAFYSKSDYGNPNGEFETYCTNLVEKAKGYRKPFIGREDVIYRTMQILCKAEKSNPVHVGEAGVGKSAVTLGLAKMIANDTVPDILKKSNLYELDLAAMLAGTRYRGDFEERLKMVLDTLNEMEKPILYIDEIHMLIGAGACGGDAMDAANILKPYLTEDKISFIGATTDKEYKKYIEQDTALARRFQRVEVVEPSITDTIGILTGLKEGYEKHHNVTFQEDAIEAAVALTAKHIHDRFLPDKAIDMLDEAGAYVNIHPGHGTIINAADISDIVCTVCKIPKKVLEADDLAMIANLEENLNKKIFGQEEATKMISESIQLSKSGLGDQGKPIGTYLFVGPSGVGKTELAKTLSETMGIQLVRFDMSEYSEFHTSAKLIGSPAGYVGYDDGGLLTNALLKTPHCVLLLDEIEKAHPSIFQMFLQMFDYGMITDSKGRKVDCRNAIIIMTSNAGAADLSKPVLGFTSGKSMINTSAIELAVNKTFSTEFRNRLTGIISFHTLNEEMSIQIAKKELTDLKQKLLNQGIDVSFTEDCIKKVAELGTSPEYGARELKRVVDSQIRSLFVKSILSKSAPESCQVDYMGSDFEILPATLPAAGLE